jgi:hypothetical protein
VYKLAFAAWCGKLGYTVLGDGLIVGTCDLMHSVSQYCVIIKLSELLSTIKQLFCWRWKSYFIGAAPEYQRCSRNFPLGCNVIDLLVWHFHRAKSFKINQFCRVNSVLHTLSFKQWTCNFRRRSLFKNQTPFACFV